MNTLMIQDPPMNILLLVAVLAVVFNLSAIVSGWGVLFRHPELMSRNFGRNFSFDPAYLCYAVVVSTTFLAMYLALLLLWWFKSPGIRSTDHLAGIIFMSYHLCTGVVTTGIHVTIGRVTRALMGKNCPVGDAKDVVVAKGSLRLS